MIGTIDALEGIVGKTPIPGIGETLRVNGKVLSINADEICIAVEECYGSGHAL